MPRPEKIETVDDIRLWITDHDARIDVWWHDQHEWNKSTEYKMHSLVERLTAVEKRVMWLSGAAAAVGSIIGALLVK